MTLWLWLLLAAAPSPDTWTWWMQPCTKDLAAQSGCEPADSELAEWALAAWQSESAAAVSRRIARPRQVDGQIGAAIYVLPDLTQLGPDIAAAGKNDRLFRHTVVYLTFLHESGHALGHPHTSDYDSIMYSFGYGGDIVEYFTRYRRKLTGREDIRKNPGIRLAAKQ